MKRQGFSGESERHALCAKGIVNTAHREERLRDERNAPTEYEIIEDTFKQIDSPSEAWKEFGDYLYNNEIKEIQVDDNNTIEDVFIRDGVTPTYYYGNKIISPVDSSVLVSHNSFKPHLKIINMMLRHIDKLVKGGN
jgi:hypothetical protein